jgi:hypothetical protein
MDLSPASLWKLRDFTRRLLRAGMLRAAACSMASAAAAMQAAPHDQVCFEEAALVAQYGGWLIGYVVQLARRCPELAAETEAALAESAALDHLSRLLVVCVASPTLAWPHPDATDTLLFVKAAAVSLEALAASSGLVDRSPGLFHGWPLHALLVCAVGHLSSVEEGAASYGLPPELLAGARVLRDASLALQHCAINVATALPTALASPGVSLRGFGRRGPVAVVLRTGGWAVRTAGGEGGAADPATQQSLCTAAVAAVCAAGRLLHGSALEAEWQREALADAWRLARDVAAAGAAAAALGNGLWQLLGDELEQGEADDCVSSVLNAAHVAGLAGSARAVADGSPHAHVSPLLCLDAGGFDPVAPPSPRLAIAVASGLLPLLEALMRRAHAGSVEAHDTLDAVLRMDLPCSARLLRSALAHRPWARGRRAGRQPRQSYAHAAGWLWDFWSLADEPGGDARHF